MKTQYIPIHKGIKPGDRILVAKSWLGIVIHHAIYLGTDFNGNELIAENEFGKYVRIVKAEEFFRNYQGQFTIEKFTGDIFQRKQAVERALRQLNKPYDLINFNCEHYANYVQNGKIQSNQIDLALGIGIFLLLIGLVSSFNNQKG